MKRKWIILLLSLSLVLCETAFVHSEEVSEYDEQILVSIDEDSIELAATPTADEAPALDIAEAITNTLVLPETLKMIEDQAFEGDSVLNEVVIPSGMESINSRAFAQSGVRRIYIPNSVTFIADDAFEGTSVTICSAIGSYAQAYAKAHGYAWEDCYTDQEAISYHGFCEMLTRIVADYGERYLAIWNSAASEALQSYRPMTRERAMLSIYEAACAIGVGDEYQFDFLQINEKMDEKNWGWDFEWNYPEWPNWENISPFTAANREINYMISALHFMQGRRSLTTGEPVFDIYFDDILGYFRAPVTYQEAVDTIRRFKESLIFTEKADSATVARINAEADARRDAILNSKTQISYTGTAYYVSSSTGNDGNDGRSPATAWQTLEHLRTQNLNYGDAVFFKRGDIWYEAYVRCQEGVTYSAYGEGQKPRFYGCAESGTGAEKWSLYYTSDNIKIWKYYHPMKDVGGIIFNDGELWAERVYGWWVVGKGLMRIDDTTKPFVVEECLSTDMTCASIIDYSGLDYPIQVWGLGNLQGDFFLRCDSGNPGALFNKVEFEVSDWDTGGWSGIFESVSNCTFDNLCIRYYGNAAIHGTVEDKGITVQNCEIGWGGNSMHEYIQSDPTHTLMISGDGIYGIGNKGVVKNNYCHDVDGGGITFETYPEIHVGTFEGEAVIRDNLVERCGQGIFLHDGQHVLNGGSILVDNNLVLRTGEGNVHGCYVGFVGIFIDDGLSLRFDEVKISNNTVYQSKEKLVSARERTILENNHLYR